MSEEKKEIKNVIYYLSEEKRKSRMSFTVSVEDVIHYVSNRGNECHSLCLRKMSFTMCLTGEMNVIHKARLFIIENRRSW